MRISIPFRGYARDFMHAFLLISRLFLFLSNVNLDSCVCVCVCVCVRARARAHAHTHTHTHGRVKIGNMKYPKKFI